MPRIGDVYSPPYDPVVSGTPIESVEYNGTVADITVDLNTPRPVVAGGTGAGNAEQARVNLAAEAAAQVVTNYDSHMWLPGSFRSATTATGAPIAGHEFAGICYLNEALAYPPTNQNLVIEATDLADPANPDQYTRVKDAGVWGPWIQRNAVTSSSNLGEYTFDNQVTFPPGSGQIRFNNATQNSTTEVFISHLSPAGVDNTSQLTFYLKSGVDLIVQDKDEGSKYKVFTTTANAVLSGGDFRVTVILKSAGADLVSAQRVLVAASGEAQRAQQRQLIYAAPFDALAYNGMQINGSFDVSQEYGFLTPVPLDAGPFCDGWRVSKLGTMAGVVQAALPASSLIQFPGIPNVCFLTITTTQASLGATDFTYVHQNLEGYRTARLGWGTANAKPVTIGFWTAHNRAGVYGGALCNSAGTRGIAFNYTQSVASAYEYKTVTLPGDTAGTWDITNGIGMSLIFAVAAGSSYIAPAAGVWYNTFYVSGPGQINAASTATWFILSGVVVLPGIEAPSAERSALIMRPYGEELAICQRYWQLLKIETNGYCPAASVPFCQFVPFPVTMRAPPTLTTNGDGSNTNVASGSFDTPTIEGCRVIVVNAAAGPFNMADRTGYANARL